MPLSDNKIRNLKPKDKPYRAADAQSLYLQVMPNGRKAWRMNYVFQGKQRTASFGAYPAVPLATARSERDKVKALLAEGIDPSEAKKAGAAPEPQGETFESVAKRWLKMNESKWVGAYAVRLRARMDQDVMPHLGSKPVAGITAKEVLDTIRKIEARGAIEMARRVRQMIGQVFRFATAEGLVQFDPSRDIGDALRPKPAPKHRSAMAASEIPGFFEKLRAYQGEACTIAGLQLVVHTAVRTNELRMAEWSEFEGLDGNDPLWRIPAGKMKMRRDHIVPLSPQAVAIVKDLRRLTGHQQWVFLNGGKPLSANTLIFAMYRLGYHSRATVHGFRSSFSTWANEREFNRDWIELALAHVDASIRGVYNSAQYLRQRREMLAAWSNFIDPPGEFDDIL